MRKLLLISASALALATNPAAAQFNGASGIYALNGQTFGLTSTWLKIVSGGSGYAPGDTLSLTCPAIGAANKTLGTVTVGSVSSGAITSVAITTSGNYTALPSSGDASAINGVCSFIQGSTSGSGSGAVISTLLAFNAAPNTTTYVGPLQFGYSTTLGLGSAANQATSYFLARTNFIVADSIDLTGATDASVALQAIVTANPTKRIYVPAGTPLINNPVTLNSGQTLQCEGRTQTVFQVNSGASGYNLASANGVFSLGTGEPGASVFDCGVNFVQPTTLTRGTVVHYPPAFYATNVPRFQIDRVRVSNGWRCLVAGGNAGGSYIGRMECGAFANDATGQVFFDGSTDFIHINSMEFWPYGMNASGQTVYEDQSGIGMMLGRVDGFAANQLAFFQQALVINSNSTLTAVPYNISVLQMDTEGSILSNAGARLQIGNWYASRSAAATAVNNIGVFSAGITTVSNVEFQNQGTAGPPISVTGGYLTINGGYIEHYVPAQPFAWVTGGQMAFNNTNDGGLIATRTQPYFWQSGTGFIILTGNQAAAQPASLAGFINVTVDYANNFIANNNFVGWAHYLPSTSLGYYDMNEPDIITATPAFQTNGTFAPASNTTTGEFFRKGDYVELSLQNSFNSNAYTGAGGAFYLALNTPTALDNEGACTLMNMAKTTFSGLVLPNIQVSTILFANPTSGAGISYAGTAFVPPSTSGVQFNIACRYRVR